MATKETKEVAHLPFLDYLRGIAILAVFFFHSVGATYGATDQLVWHGWFRDFHVGRTFLLLLPFTVGWSGVLLFFVISGFCIHLSHERSRDKKLDVYALRRFFRIYPPYLLAVLIFGFCRLPLRTHFGASMAAFAKHLFLINNLYRTPGGINGSFWSVAAECQLYALYPFLLWLTARGGWRLSLWFTVGVWILLPYLPAGVSRSPFDFWCIWVLGAALADAWLKERPLPFRWLPFPYWFAMALACYFFAPAASLINPAFGLGAVSLIAYCLERPELTFPRGLGVVMNHVRATGVVSYSAYLIHQPMIKLSLIILRRAFHLHYLHPLLSFAFCVSTWLIIFPASWLFHRYVETPSIALGKWIIQRRRHLEFLSGEAAAKKASA